MRGVWSLPAAAVGLVVVLLFMPVIQGQEGWGVTYSPYKICALKGSTVEINCTYRYSPTKRPVTTVNKTVWFSRENYHGPVDLSTDLRYSGRVQSHCENNICTLRIRDVRESDSAEYKLRFKTNQPHRRFTGSPGVTLSVTGLQVIIPGHQSYGKTEIQCRSSLCLPDHTSFIWYKNGQKLHGETSSSYSSNMYSSYSTDSYSCALKGHEDFHSPSACRDRDRCKKVTYNQRSICAPKGSSVDISCTYYRYYVESKFWFSTPRSHQWQSPSQPQDLSKDTKFNGRVQVLEPETGRSTLRISDLTENDSAEYRFKFRTRWFEWGNSLPGTTLTVTVLQVKVTRVKVHQSYTEAELECRNSCISASYLSYVWFKNGQKVIEEQSFSYKGQFNPGDTISCALKEHKTYRSPSLYALKVPSVSVNPSAEVMENSSVTLTCSTDAYPAANYTWYKKNRDSDPQPLSKESKFVFRSIKSSDFGEYYCTAENELGKRTSENISVIVRYPPKLPSVSVSPSGEIVEGSSVTLTCSSDANPAANYTWYKENQTLIQGPKGVYHFTSISSEDRGNYYCKSENHYGQNSTFFFLDVHYAPKLPSVSVSPSGEIVESSSVTLTCSSDANPAANYTWYKENEDSPKASGQIFTITDSKAEDSGNYYCEAQNRIGRHTSTLSLTVRTGAWKSISAVTTTAVFLLIMLFTVPVLIRKKKASKQSPEPEGRPDNREQYLPAQRQSDDEQNDLNYASVRFYKNQDDSLYSNIGAAQHLRHQEAEDHDVDYAAVQFISSSSSSTAPRHQKSAAEDAYALYSTVNKTR